jgi:hypothetical protein
MPAAWSLVTDSRLAPEPERRQFTCAGFTKNRSKLTMKTIIHRITNQLSLLAIISLVVLATGCSTTKQTEDLLSAAGFKLMPATTAAQKAHLKSLPAGKVTTVQRSGTTYFVYPAVAKQALYVGQQPQYQEYKKLQLQNQIAMDQLQAAELNSDPGWNEWGVWDGAFGFPAPGLRR